jgi:23S rRNA pseudouridine1911/1915/1917 synthase
MTTQNPLNPKHAITHGEVLGYIDDTYTAIKIDLETGRTHQIRVHLASIGYPIIGDKVYGNPKVNTTVATLYQLHRQALHAFEIHLDLYKERRIFQAEIKHDMQNLLQHIPLS